MGVRYPTSFSTAIANALPASNAETIICVLPPLNLSIDGAAILLFWYANVLIGASTTVAIFQIRLGATLAGALIFANSAGVTTVAGNFITTSGCYVHVPGIVAGQQYNLTCTQTGATGAGTLRDVMFGALVL